MVLAQDTDVILMDEPTTFLDIRNQLELLERARSLAGEGKTVVVILHDFEAVLHYADHVILLSEGHVLKAGAAEDVLRSGELADAFGVSLGFYETEEGVHCYVKGGAPLWLQANLKGGRLPERAISRLYSVVRYGRAFLWKTNA